MSHVQSVVRVDPELLSGTPVFAGTRVPVQTLLDYLRAGDRVDDFLDDFPTVTREQVTAVLDAAGRHKALPFVDFEINASRTALIQTEPTKPARDREAREGSICPSGGGRQWTTPIPPKTST